MQVEVSIKKTRHFEEAQGEKISYNSYDFYIVKNGYYAITERNTGLMLKAGIHTKKECTEVIKEFVEKDYFLNAIKQAMQKGGISPIATLKI